MIFNPVSLVVLLMLCSGSVMSSANNKESLASKQWECSTLGETISTPRWFSYPNSRIVLNPSISVVTDRQQLVRYSWEGAISPLRVNVACFVGPETPEIPMLWAWYPGSKASDKFSAFISEKVAFPENPSDYGQGDGVHIENKEGALCVTLNPERTWGWAPVEVSADLDKTPWMVVNASNSDGRWSFKIISDTETRDISMSSYGMTGKNSSLVNIQKATGWTGKKKFTVRLFVVGAPGSSATFSSIRLVGTRNEADRFQDADTNWYPHKMVTETRCPGQSMDVKGTTYFSDDSTISQCIKVTRAGSGKLILNGLFNEKNIKWVPAKNALILQSKKYHAVIAVNRKAKWLGKFQTWEDWMGNKPDKASSSSIWAMEFNGLKDGDQVIASARFTPTYDGVDATIAKVVKTIKPQVFEKNLARLESEWNARLERVPHPKNFNLHILDPLGSTPDEIRKSYYRAWVFLYDNILPPMPEIGYPYPQVAAGKPSLWPEGHPKARYSAQWESMIGIHILALADPSTAWAALKGMMSLVDEKGMMAGEGLPARHYRAAWGIYTQNGDKTALRAEYANMKRYLLFKFARPVWLHKAPRPLDAKAFGFSAWAMFDTEYAIRVAKVLDMPEEVDFWQKYLESFKSNFDKWFWETPNGPAYQGCLADTLTRSGKGYGGLIEGLVLDRDILTQPQVDYLMDLARRQFKTERPLIFPGLTKEPNQNSIILGMWRYGTMDETATIAESQMRSMALARDFGEEYTQSNPPMCCGVSPSLFGATMMIESALWHNGIIPDDGLPLLAHLPNAAGVDGFNVRGLPITVHYISDNEVLLSGKGLKFLKKPEGFSNFKQNDGAPCWRGTLAIGKELRLQEAPGKW